MTDKDTQAIQTITPANTGLSPMVQAVMDGQMTPEQLQQLLNVQKDYEKNEAEKAFNMAVAEFKKKPPKIIKDKLNKKYGSKYVTKGNLVNTVNEAMAPYGLNSSWGFPSREDGLISVTCTLSHAMGHSKSVTLSGPPDASGSKNPLQEIKSTITYLMIVTYEAVTGIAASDDGDDDGNGAGSGSVLITEEQANELHAMLEPHNLVEPFIKWLEGPPIKANSFSRIRADRFNDVKRKASATIKARAGQTNENT